MISENKRYKMENGVTYERFFCVYLQDINKPEDSPMEIFFISRSDAIALEYLVLGLPKEGVPAASADLLKRARRFKDTLDINNCIKEEYLTPEKIVEFEKRGMIL